MRIAVLIVTCTLLLASSSQAATYTYPDLVSRLTDLQWLAKVPPAGEKTSMASSYDRASQYDAATDRYIHWDANGDGDGVVRMEGKQAVLADIQGPGCIVRMWSARAKAGHVKMFLDGEEKPAIDLPFSSYFDGTVQPFNRPNLVYKTTPGTREGGLDNFTPIPFQKSCKIVADPDWGVYYQITYTQFPAGTVVPSFTMNLSADDAAALDRANELLGHCGPFAAKDDKADEHQVTASAGHTSAVAQLTGPDAITSLRVKLDIPKDPAAAQLLLRQLAIQITWDDEKTPAVWAPLADFFGCFGGSGSYQSLPLGLTSDGTFYSNWYMPFASSAKIEIINDGPTDVPMTWQIAHAPPQTPIAELNRFHAKYHRDAFLPTRPDRDADWTMLTAKGSGRYVGTQLHVWCPRGGWWGEGDDKFFVDGEKFPSSFGTGSEDYFGAAWGLTPFDRPFHGALSSDPAHSVAHRWHIPDSVPFQTAMEADIEKYWANDRPALYENTVYWYLSVGGDDPYPAVGLSDRLVDYTPPPILHVPDVIEGESLEIIKKQPDTARYSVASSAQMPIMSVSGDRFLSWRAKTADDLMEVKLPVQSEGDYRVMMCFMKRRTGGIFQLQLDGSDLAAPIDLYEVPPGHQGFAVDALTDMGIHHLTAGDHVLSVKLVGMNPAGGKPVNGMDFAMDYLKLIAEKK